MGNSDDSSHFGLYIQHGGKFYTLDGSNHYVGGVMVPRHNCCTDKFTYKDIEEEVGRLGYVSWKAIIYKVPNSFDYKVIENDDDAREMVSYINDRCAVLHLFVDDGKLVGTGEVDEVSEDNQCNWDEDEWQGDISEVDKEGNHEANHTEEVRPLRETESDSEDSDFIPQELEDDSTDQYTDDDMSDDALCSDSEYIEARRVLRDRSGRGLCGDVFNKAGLECGDSDYEHSSGDVDSEETDEDGDNVRRRNRRVVYNPVADPRTFKLEMHMRFANGLEARDAIRRQAIEDGRQIQFRRVSPTQMEAHCNPPCKWRVYGSLVKSTGSFEIKRLYQPHTCTTTIRNKIVTSAWIAKEYLNVFRNRPDLKVKELSQDILRRYNCHVSKWKLYKAKDKAIRMLRGTVEEHYAKMRSYILELKRADVEGRFELNVDVGAVFKGIYIGFSSLRKGFMDGCRSVIGLDGAFLKTYLGGVLLCVVATDANNSMYPIAWAVVQVENLENWLWFLRILVDDLVLSGGGGITFISDQQKGLLRAVSEVAPLADHRNCARHIYINWKKNNKGLTLKNLFWRIVRSTHMAEYNAALDAMKEANAAAYEDFVQRDTTKFCKVFFNPQTVCDMNLNNISETFNGYILSARSKHVIHMLEDIRISLMSRLCRKRGELREYGHRICPEIVRKVEEKKKFSRYCIAHASSDVLFEVEHLEHRFVVDIEKRGCSCRGWQLSGYPCVHACAAIHLLREDATNYCHEAYSVVKYRDTYKYGLPPLNGELLWPRAEGFPVVPPEAKKMPGRPKKKRKRDANEGKSTADGSTKAKRYGLQMTCGLCKQVGHNKRSCKNAPVQSAPKPRGKPGRPRKSEAQQTTMNVTGSSAASVSTSVGAATGSTSMGEAGRIFTHMPNERRTIFIPPRPTTTGSTRKNGKKRHISTQESQV